MPPQINRTTQGNRIGDVSARNRRVMAKADYCPRQKIGNLLVNSVSLYPHKVVVKGNIPIIHVDVLSTSNRRSSLPASPLPPHDKSRYPHGPAPKSWGAFVAGFKSSVTKRLSVLDNAPGVPIGQRNYVSRALCGATNISSATNPITNVLPGTSPPTLQLDDGRRKPIQWMK